MKQQQKNIVIITIRCRDLSEMQKAKEAVLYHLETLNPELSAKGNTLTVRVIPLAPKLFWPGEACDIIYCTLEPKLDFVKEWECTLHTINPKH